MSRTMTDALSQASRRIRNRTDLHDSIDSMEPNQYKRARHDNSNHNYESRSSSSSSSSSSSTNLNTLEQQFYNDVKAELETHILNNINNHTSNNQYSNGIIHSNCNEQMANDTNHSELECVVCLSLPDSDILQCENGHLLCKQCWRKVVDSQRSVCPTCRVKLNRDKPHRNRFAESCLAKLLMPCTNHGCKQLIQFSQLSSHCNELCDYRIVKCKYELLGCKWNDIPLLYKQHIKQCAIKSQPIKQLLHNVTELHAQYNELQQQQLRSYESQVQLSKILRKRCRNMEIRDILVERDGLDNNIRCSKIFKCIGLAWEVYITTQSHNKPQNKNNHTIDTIKIHFKIISNIKHKTTIELFVLNGPGLDVQFNPTLRRIIFRKKVKLCEPFLLPCTPEQANDIYNMDSVNLRVGFLDVSAGRVKSSFTTLNRTVHDDSDSSDDSDDSVCEHEIVHLPYNTIHPDTMDDDTLDEIDLYAMNSHTDISDGDNNSDILSINTDTENEQQLSGTDHSNQNTDDESEDNDDHHIIHNDNVYDVVDSDVPSELAYSDIDDLNHE